MDDPENEARALLMSRLRPRRRPAPRVAPSLVDADYRLIEGVATWRLGQGPAVLLVHGWEDDNTLWAELIEALVWRGAAVVALDLPGHGFSEGDDAPALSTAARLARVAEAAGPIAAAAGHSYGCVLLAFMMAEHDFAPGRAALVASPIDQASQFAHMCARYDVPPDIADAAIAIWAEIDGRPIEAFDLRLLAPRLRAQGLVAHSIDDDGCPIEPALEAASLWPACETLIVDGLGHRAIAKDRDVVARLAEFLAP